MRTLDLFCVEKVCGVQHAGGLGQYQREEMAHVFDGVQEIELVKFLFVAEH